MVWRGFLIFVCACWLRSMLDRIWIARVPMTFIAISVFAGYSSLIIGTCVGIGEAACMMAKSIAKTTLFI